MNSSTEQPRPGTGHTALTGALLLVLVAWFLLTASYRGALNRDSGVRGGDFKFFYFAAQRLNTGQPLYEQDLSRAANAAAATLNNGAGVAPVSSTAAGVEKDLKDGATYVYTPLLALLLKPIAAATGNNPTEVPERALELWFFASSASLVLAIAIFSLAMRWTLRHAALIAIIAIIAFRFWPTVMTFGLGQSNLLLVTCLAAVFWADSRDRLYAAAFFIALGALFKTWFIAFVLYLLVRRAWKATVACGLFSVVGLAILFTIAGWNQLPLFVGKTLGYAASQMGNQVLSQSIAGFAQLHFTANRHIDPLINSTALALMFKAGGYLVMLAGLAAIFFRGAATSAAQILRLSVVSLTVLLLLPYCQNEYLVLTLPALWVLLTQPKLAGLLAFAAALFAYVLFTRGGPYYPNDAQAYRTGLRSLMVSVPFFMVCLLWLVTFAAYWRASKPQLVMLDSTAPASRSTASRESSPVHA